MTTLSKELKIITTKNRISNILDELMGKYISIHELKERLENIGEEKCTYHIDYHYTEFSEATIYIGDTSTYSRYELGLDKLECKDFEAYISLKRVIIGDTMLILNPGLIVVEKR